MRTENYTNLIDKGRYIIAFMAIICLSSHSLFAQMANVTYSTRSDFVTSHENFLSLGPCYEVGDEEYTSYMFSRDNVNASEGSTGCRTCDNNGDCTYNTNNAIVTNRTNNSTDILFRLDAWEDDSGDRCTYNNSGNILVNDDDCRRQESQWVNFRVGATPSNSLFTVTPTWGSTDDHTWRGQYTWKYSGTASALTPTCSNQTASYSSGEIRSFSVYLTNGATYRFSNCGSSGDTYIRLFAPNGFSQVTANDDFCGFASASEFDYTAATTGWHYLEISDYPRSVVSNSGTLSYRTLELANPISANCPSNITVNNTTGQCGAVVAFSGYSASNACGTLTETLSYASGSFFPVGTTTVTYTVSDQTNTASCSFNITVNDNQAPSISCPSDISVESCSATSVVYPNASASDNCPGLSAITYTQASGSIFAFGSTTVTASVVDASGNNSSCSFNVVVQDTEPPTSSCNDFTVELNASGEFAIDGGLLNTVTNASDACGVSFYNLSGINNTATCNDKGTKAITIFITDVNGNQSSCSVNITVEDPLSACNQPPVAVCQDITVSANGSCQGNASPSDFDGGSFDPDGDPMTFAVAPSGPYSLGATAVTLTVSDPDGEVDDCAATITVVDDTPPTIDCPNDITISCEEDASPGGVTGFATYSDNCDIAFLDIIEDVNAGSCPSESVIVRTYITEDNTGNPAICSQIITIVDETPPTIACPPDITVDCVDEVPTCDPFDASASDNCGVPDVTCAQGSLVGDEWNGTVTNTYTAIDDCDNTANCTQTIVIDDQVPPTISCPADITINCDEDPEDFDLTGLPDVSDNCVSAGYGPGDDEIIPGDCPGNYVILRPWETGDENGNTASCTQTITVVDVTPPTIACPTDITVACLSDVPACDPADASASDNCGTPEVFCDQGPLIGDEWNGTVTNTYTAIDDCGNTATCSQTIHVYDNVPPTAVCQDITVELLANGSTSVSASDIDGGSSDNCSPVSLSIAEGTDAGLLLDCSDVGSNLATLIVEDENGNVSDCEANVEVEDNTAPTAVCQDITVQLDAAGNASINSSDIDGGSSDACEPLDLFADIVSFDCSDAEPQPLVASGLFISEYIEGSSFNKCVEIFNGTGAAVNLGGYDIQIYFNGSGSAGQTIGLSGTLADGDVYVVCNSSAGADFLAEADLTTGSLSYNGDDAVVLRLDGVAIDVFGHIGEDPGSQWSQGGNSTQNETVVRNDNVTSGNTADAAGFPSLGTEWSALGEDNSSSLGSHALATSAAQPVAVVLTVTDQNGNSSTCTAAVTVEDNIPPDVTCHDFTLQLDASGIGILTAGDIDANFDACGVASLELSRSEFTCADIGAAPGIWINEIHYDNDGSDVGEAVEIAGYSGIDPTAYSVVLYNGSNGEQYNSLTLGAYSVVDAGIGYIEWQPGSNGLQNGAPDGIALVGPSGVVEFLSYEGSFTATNGPAAGLTSTDIGVSETSSTPIGQSLQRTGGFGSAWTGPLASTFQALNTGQVIPPPAPGPQSILTATDIHGNSSSCTANITVEDNVAPTAACLDIVLPLDATGNASIDVADVDGGTADACGIDEISIDVSAFDCSDVAVGGPYTGPAAWINEFHYDNDGGDVGEFVEVAGPAGTDLAGYSIVLYNGSNGETYDTEALAGVIADEGDGFGALSFPISGIQNGGPDGIALVGPTGLLEFLSYEGDFTAVNGPANGLTSTDVGVNETSSTPIGESLQRTGGAGSAWTGPATASPGALNSGQVVAVAASTPVVLTATDIYGNTSSCTANVTVIDNLPPTAVCQDITIELSSENGTSYNVDQEWESLIDGGSSDNCGISSISIDVDAFDCGDVGANTVELTVEDVNGNVSTCSSTVTVEDNVPPTALCQDVTVQLDANGQYVFQASESDAGSYDNCGILTILVNGFESFTLSCLNTNAPATVLLTAIDVNGNSATCPTTITTLDLTPPVASCDNLTVELDASGNASVSAGEVDNGSSDACGIASLSLSPTQFDCGNVGGNLAELTVEDANGNTSSCTSIITVQDNIAPVVSCADITLDLGLDCNLAIDADDVATYSDACGIQSATVTPNSFTTADAGDNLVTVEVTDNNGNTASCTATVTVLTRSTTLTNLGVFEGQYSDYPVLQARLNDDLTGNPLAGYTIEFSLNGRTATAVTDASGIATTDDIRLDQAPNVLGPTYDIVSTFAGFDCYDASSDTDPFEILQEDAYVVYTGTEFAATANQNSSEATILLSATVADISSSPVPGGDFDPGDIGNATVTFINRETGNPISPPLPVNPLPGDSTVGTVAYEWTVDIGNADFETFVIGVIVDNYYTRNSTEDDALVSISLPGCEFITGGGYFIAQSSEGVYAADPGTRVNFGFNVKYNAGGNNLQGRFTAIVRRIESDGILHVYRIKGNRMTSLGIDPSTITNFAEFTGNANITDVTDPNNEFGVEGNGELRMWVYDNGTPGAGVDLIGIQLYRQGELMFASGWNGFQVANQLIDGGNIVVHGCNGPSDPCAGSPDSDGDGVCDPLDVCPGGDDNIDTDGDEVPDACDDCSNVLNYFADAPLMSGDGSPVTTSAFIGGGTDVSFTLTNVNARLNGNASRRYIDYVEVTYTDPSGTSHSVGTYSGDALPLPSVDILIPGPVQEIFVTLSNSMGNGASVGIDMTAVNSCGGGGARTTFDPSGATVTEDESKESLVKEIISSVYPNPFNARAVIEFTLPEAGETTLEVISLTGEVVRSLDLGLVDGDIRQQYELIPDNSMGSGTYLYRIVSGKHIATRKLLYVK